MLERHSNQFAELFCISKLLSVKDTNSSSTSRESHVIHSTVVRALHDFTSYYYSYKVHSKCSGRCFFILQSLAHTQAKSGKAWIATSVGSATNKTLVQSWLKYISVRFPCSFGQEEYWSVEQNKFAGQFRCSHQMNSE